MKRNLLNLFKSNAVMLTTGSRTEPGQAVPVTPTDPLPVMVVDGNGAPALGTWLSDQGLAVGAAPAALTVPATAHAGIVEAQTSDVWFRLGGLTPDANVHLDLRVGERVHLTREELLTVRFVRATGTDGRININYYGAPA